jgi:hypothetical protein
MRTGISLSDMQVLQGVDGFVRPSSLGHPLFLSPYSPEFQPIEFAFSKIKRRFRSLYPWQDNNVNEALEESTNCVSNFLNTLETLEVTRLNMDTRLDPNPTVL